jgi:hypothetical protein
MDVDKLLEFLKALDIKLTWGMLVAALKAVQSGCSIPEAVLVGIFAGHRDKVIELSGQPATAVDAVLSALGQAMG